MHLLFHCLSICTHSLTMMANLYIFSQRESDFEWQGIVFLCHKLLTRYSPTSQIKVPETQSSFCWKKTVKMGTIFYTYWSCCRKSGLMTPEKKNLNKAETGRFECLCNGTWPLDNYRFFLYTLVLNVTLFYLTVVIINLKLEKDW